MKVNYLINNITLFREEGLFLELIPKYLYRCVCRQKPHRLCRKVWTIEVLTGELRVIHFIRIARSLFAIPGPVHIIGPSLVLPELAGEIRKILHANTQARPQIPPPCSQGYLQKRVYEEDRAGGRLC